MENWRVGKRKDRPGSVIEKRNRDLKKQSNFEAFQEESEDFQTSVKKGWAPAYLEVLVKVRFRRPSVPHDGRHHSPSVPES